MMRYRKFSVARTYTMQFRSYRKEPVFSVADARSPHIGIGREISLRQAGESHARARAFPMQISVAKFRSRPKRNTHAATNV
eukprot:3436666-Pyramimonas_sp.AAC.1